MCLGTNDEGGPYRCSSHARHARDRAQRQMQNDLDTMRDLDEMITEGEQRQATILATAAPDQNSFLALLHKPEDILPTDAYNEYRKLDTDLAEHRDHRGSIARCERRRRDALDQAEADYRATPDGIGEAMRDLRRLETAPVDPESRHLRVKALREGLSDIQKAEDRMAQEGFERQQRWGKSSKPIVRGADTGAQTTISGSTRMSAAGLLVHEADMHGSYTNTFTPDPDGMEDAGAPASGDRAIRHSTMEIVRPDNAPRRRITIPMHTASTFNDTSGPTVRDALLSAVERAESYKADYPTWARENGYSATDQGWTGSSSYSLGKEAHKEAWKVRARIRKFLDPDEYKRLAEEVWDRAYA